MERVLQTLMIVDLYGTAPSYSNKGAKVREYEGMRVRRY